MSWPGRQQDKRLVEDHNKMVSTIEEQKKSILQLNTQLSSAQGDKEKFDADLTISMERQKKTETDLASSSEKLKLLVAEYKKLQLLYNEETAKAKTASEETARMVNALNTLKVENARLLAAQSTLDAKVRAAAAVPARTRNRRLRNLKLLSSQSAPAPAVALNRKRTPRLRLLPRHRRNQHPEMMKTRFYTVKSGDTLSRIETVLRRGEIL
jgi:nucleoid-associated protein YgaU